MIGEAGAIGHDRMPKLPPFWGSDKLTKYLDTAQHNTIATCNNLPGVFRRLRDINEAFSLITENLDYTREWFPAFFLFRAHSTYLAAVRLATSGQSPEAYMILRGCLENSLYGFCIYAKPELADVWLRREENQGSKRRFDKHFKIGQIKPVLEQSDPHLAKAVQEFYDRTIAFGAHPNPNSILTNLVREKTETFASFRSLYLQCDSETYMFALRTTLQIGVCSLKIFRIIFKERFDLLGISEKLPPLTKDL
jgi:hypothetical protein